MSGHYAGWNTPRPKSPRPTATVVEMLKMDGRKAAPEPRIFRKFPASAPKIVAVKRAIYQFLSEGESGMHSSYGILLRYIVAYCEENNIGYQLTRAVLDGRAAGYSIKRIADLSELKSLEEL